MAQALSAQQIHALFEDGVVRHGPFAGLKYPELTAIGSTLYPKLLGSYEAEIHQWIQEICADDYSEIIDIGCGEGYYAVGLARRITQAMVYAYDESEEAKLLCAKFGAANHVAYRLSVRGLFTADELVGIPIRRRGLIICDCEGGESHIFDEQTSHRFADWDLLIETHD